MSGPPPGRRYAVHGVIGRGGTAVVHLGMLVDDRGATRFVAIKRLHEGLATNPQLIASLIDEARITSHIRHPNVVSTLEVVAADGQLDVVMDYVEGEPLSQVLGAFARRGERIPASIVASLMVGVLRGLHAAHEARDAQGVSLGVIHRDVSPQNIMVGTDGLAHVVDFGIAKAVGRAAQTATGEVKGKLGYMAPEQLQGGALDRRVDVYAAGVVLWEALTSERLFRGGNDSDTLALIRGGRVDPPSARLPGLPAALDAVVLEALNRSPQARFSTAEAMARALESATVVASPGDVAVWASAVTAETTETRRRAMKAAAASATSLLGALRARLRRRPPA